MPPKRHVLALIAIGAIALIDGAAGQSLRRAQLVDPVDGDLLPYRHPLQQRPDNVVPFFDAKDSPSGLRYAVLDSNEENEKNEGRSVSAVVEIEHRPFTSTEIAELAKEKDDWAKEHGIPIVDPQTDSTVDPKPKRIGVHLRSIMASCGSSAAPVGDDEPLRVQVRLRRPDEHRGLQSLVEEAIARGQVHTRADIGKVRDQGLATRADQIRARQAGFAAALKRLGGRVLSRSLYLPALEIEARCSVLAALVEHESLELMEVDLRNEEEVDGNHVREGSQLRQFIEVSPRYDGENGSGTDVRVAVIENMGVEDEHVGWHDTSSAGTERFAGRYQCDGSGCSSTSNFGVSDEGSHATAVTGIIIGDLEDGQDASFSSSSDRRARSGYAPEARVYMYSGNGLTSGVRSAYDDIIAKSTNPPVVINQSSGSTGDPTCDGDDSVSKDANDLFMDGHLLVKSAGNSGHSSSTDCTVTSPGAAIGVFTVGAHGQYCNTGDADEVRTADIRTSSSRGGVTASEGNYRSIVDITAFGCRDLLFDIDLGYDECGCGTSYAAPTVSAAMVDLLDHYTNTVSSLMETPGILYVTMLLNSDRQGESSYLTSGFDDLFGGGRLQMRRLDTYGMDGPYGWGIGWTCIDDGETHTITINSGSALSADVDHFKAAIFWFDRRHDNAISKLDDVDLKLKTTSGTTLRSSVSSYDNKERVYYDGIGGQAVKLEIYGWDVKTDKEGCGTNSMKVYYAYYYEDSDRDDGNGPSGVETDSDYASPSV